jgi:hypothetical protein
MFEVVSKNGSTLTVCDTLDQAMGFAKTVNSFVTIKGGEMEIVGVFGADTIKDGKCPDGVDYTWKKRRN